MFYRTENVFRWCEMVTEEKQVKQSIEERAVTRYQALTHDDLEKMQETICSTDDLKKWLMRHQLPPDGYKPPFDGTYNTELTEKMLAEIRRVRYVKRFYALLSDENANVCDLLNVAMYCFLDEEQIDESLRCAHMQKYVDFIEKELGDMDARMHVSFLFQRIVEYENTVNGKEYTPMSWEVIPNLLAEHLCCIDECIHMMLGFSPTMQDTFVCVKFLSAIWADICRESGIELQEKFGCNKGYRACNSQIMIPWWQNPKAVDIIKEKFEEQREYIKYRMGYYLDRYYGRGFKYKRVPGKLYREETEYSNVSWMCISEMLSDVLSGEFYIKGSALWQFLVSSMDEFLAENINHSKIQVNTQQAQTIFVSEKIVDSLYVSLVNSIMDGNFHYRKCLLCNRYFDYGNKVNRKYCDIHNGPNAEYYRRTLNKKLGNIV